MSVFLEVFLLVKLYNYTYIVHPESIFSSLLGTKKKNKDSLPSRSSGLVRERLPVPSFTEGGL